MPPREGIRILAVEDNPDTLKLLRYMLEPHYAVAFATTVDEAADIARQQPFDLFLLDINLGEQRTGTDLLHLLRAQPAHHQTPALALTAYAMPGDRERFEHDGFDGYVSKPFTRRELVQAIDAISRDSASAS